MNYINIPKKTLGKEFNTSDQIVMLEIMSNTNLKKNSECFKTVKTIAENTNMSEREVIRSTAKLEEEGLIKKEQRFNSSSIYHVCEYEGFIMVPLKLIEKFKEKKISNDLLIMYIKLLKIDYSNNTKLESGVSDKYLHEKTFFCRAKVKKIIEEMEWKNLIKITKINKYNYKIELLEGNCHAI